MNLSGVITATSFVTADKIIHDGDTNTTIRFPAADTITAETAGVERFRVDSSGMVGIGTDNPGQRLEVFDDDVALTLVSFQMDWSMEQSQIVGTKILDSLDKVTHLRRREVQQASFQVLNSPDIPSILIETGYLTNPDEARRLISSSFQQSIAQAIAQGITNYFVELSPDGTLVAWQNENGLSPMTYIVENGDSLSMIALKHSTNVESLMSINELSSDVLQIGQKLQLNEVSRVVISEHTIRSGETLSEIAVRYSVNLDKLRAANNLRNDKIFVGQVLKIPTS